jgi:hypothetical protein
MIKSRKGIENIQEVLERSTEKDSAHSYGSAFWDLAFTITHPHLLLRPEAS